MVPTLESDWPVASASIAGIAGKTIISYPLSSFEAVLQQEALRINSRPLITEKEVGAISRHFPRMTDAILAVRNLIWQADGQPPTGRRERTRQEAVARDLLEALDRGEHLVYPHELKNRLPLIKPETEFFLYAPLTDRATHLAVPRRRVLVLPRSAVAIPHGQGSPRIDLIKDFEQPGIRFSMRTTLRSAENEATVYTYRVNDLVTEYGAGLMGLAPFIDVEGTNALIGGKKIEPDWLNPFSIEDDLKERVSVLIDRTRAQEIPLVVDSIATEDAVITLRGSIAEVIANNRLIHADGSHLIIPIHTHPALPSPKDVVRQNLLRSFQALNLTNYRDPSDILAPQDVLNYLDFHKRAESDVYAPIFGVAAIDDAGGLTRPLFVYNRLKAPDNLWDIAWLARDQLVYVKENQIGVFGEYAQDALGTFFREIDDNSVPFESDELSEIIDMS